MTTKQITINRGNQYDSNGYRITDGVLCGYGKKREGGRGFSMNGNLFRQAGVDEAIKATLNDGLARTITIDTIPTIREIPESKACPKCGTYCMGDCDNG